MAEHNSKTRRELRSELNRGCLAILEALGQFVSAVRARPSVSLGLLYLDNTINERRRGSGWQEARCMHDWKALDKLLSEVLEAVLPVWLDEELGLQEDFTAIGTVVECGTLQAFSMHELLIGLVHALERPETLPGFQEMEERDRAVSRLRAVRALCESFDPENALVALRQELAKVQQLAAPDPPKKKTPSPAGYRPLKDLYEEAGISRTTAFRHASSGGKGNRGCFVSKLVGGRRVAEEKSFWAWVRSRNAT